MTVHDHDQRFKMLLKEFFEEFFHLFLSEQAALLNFSEIEWLENEAFPEPPQGRRRVFDLVAKVSLSAPVRSDDGVPIRDLVTIVHVEIESGDSVKAARQTMFQYYAHLRQKYAEPILPLALYLRVGQEGIGMDHYAEHFGGVEVLRYNYWYVGLPGLDGENYLLRDEPLAVALSVLMKQTRHERVLLRALATKHVLATNENDYRKFLLAELIQAYTPLGAEEQQQFESLIATDDYREVREMATTWFEQGIEQGIEQGVVQGQRALAAMVLEKRFGPLTSQLQALLESWPENRLSDLIDWAYKVESPDELPAPPNGSPS